MKATDSAFDGKRILIVEDNAQLRRSLRTLLEAQDHWEVSGEAADGMEAIAKIREQEFDVILLDLQMPRMDGLQVAKHIISRTPDMPILMVSMHASQQLWNEARKVGIRGVCGKADIKCVVEAVKTVLENKPYFGNLGPVAAASRPFSYCLEQLSFPSEFTQRCSGGGHGCLVTTSRARDHPPPMGSLS